MILICIRLFAIFLMIAAGIFARRRQLIDDATTPKLAKLVTNIFYPALIYSSLIANFTFPELMRNWTLPAGAFLIMLTGFLIGGALSINRYFSEKRLRAAFRFQCTINNYIFLPMPLVAMRWGDAGVALLIFSSVGSEVAVWTLGLLSLSEEKQSPKKLLHQLLSTPMLAILAATLTLAIKDIGNLSLEGKYLTEIVDSVISTLRLFGGGAVPLAMIIAGSRMAELKTEHLFSGKKVFLLVLRLVAIPGVAILLLRLLPLPEVSRQVLYVLAIMPASITSVMLTELYGGDGEFSASTVLLTHAVSLFTIPLWLAWLL